MTNEAITIAMSEFSKDCKSTDTVVSTVAVETLRVEKRRVGYFLLLQAYVRGVKKFEFNSMWKRSEHWGWSLDLSAVQNDRVDVLTTVQFDVFDGRKG